MEKKYWEKQGFTMCLFWPTSSGFQTPKSDFQSKSADRFVGFRFFIFYPFLVIFLFHKKIFFLFYFFFKRNLTKIFSHLINKLVFVPNRLPMELNFLRAWIFTDELDENQYWKLPQKIFRRKKIFILFDELSLEQCLRIIIEGGWTDNFDYFEA